MHCSLMMRMSMSSLCRVVLEAKRADEEGVGPKLSQDVGINSLNGYAGCIHGCSMHFKVYEKLE